METEATDDNHDQEQLVNYDTGNELIVDHQETDDDNDLLGYHSEEYPHNNQDIEEEDEDEDNNLHLDGHVLVKRGITRLYKFRQKYGKPNVEKLSVTFDALNRISGAHRALFSSFLGDVVREQIGLCCKARSAAAKMARAKCIYPHTMGRGGYAHVKEKMV